MKKRYRKVLFLITLGVSFLIVAINCRKEDEYWIVTDGSGYVYNTVTIGTQRWMSENLKATRYNDGTALTFANSNESWVYTGYSSSDYGCYYNNDHFSNGDTYGVLYNWSAVNNIKNLCPVGWHIPSDDEWTTLINYLGGQNIAGGKLKETGTIHWQNNNAGVTNESGFSALPGGYRDYRGEYNDLGYGGFWWSADDEGKDILIGYMINSSNTNVNRINFNKLSGLSVRCLED